MNRTFKIFAIIAAVIIVGFSAADLSSENYSMAKAEKLYRDQCSKCHRNDGRGIKRIYPPLKNADYVKQATTENLLRGIIFGRSGEITVNGVTYNGVMTTEIEAGVSNEEVAMILTYIYKEFNGMDKTVSATEVAAARKKGKLPDH
ncbi:MAG: c-type cytochrome [Candidatus Kapaibacterium sp.]